LGLTERHLLVVSAAGRGLIDINNGEKVARDQQVPTASSTWIDEVSRTVEAIGPLAGTAVACVGLWGGVLPNRSAEWRLEVKASGPREFVLLVEEHTGLSRQLVETITEVRAFGFSNSGRVIVVATASDVWLYARTG
jgi:hypothetical protein